MTKICHMTSAHPAEDVRIFHKECVSLANASYDVYLVQRGDSYDKNGVHIVGAGNPEGGRLSRMLRFTKKVYQTALQIDADIYHFHDPELLPYALKLKKKGKYVIFDSHEKYTEQIASKPYLPGWAAKLISKVYGCFENFVLKRIDAVVFPCTMQGKNPFAGKCRRVSIISNAAILEEFYDCFDMDIPREDRTVCYVGGLTEDRGITVNMQAAYRANAKLVLAGKFSPSGYHEQLQQRAEYGCVDYRGMLSRQEVRALLASCQIGLCTLLDRGQYLKIDTFGIKVYEYMSMGLPVILSRSDYNQKMVDAYQFGLCVDPENPDSVSHAIRYLLDNPKEAKQMGDNGRRAIKEEFNWGVEEKKLLALYEDIIERKPSV